MQAIECWRQHDPVLYGRKRHRSARQAEFFFVLAGIAIAARDWARVDSEISSLKRRMVSWAKPEDWEIKGRDLRRGEKFFRGQDWEKRAVAFESVAETLRDSPCEMFAVQVDKRALPDYVATDSDLYRLAFWRLLEEMEDYLESAKEEGMLLLDMRSDMHSSVQDRRLIDAYREWAGLRLGRSRFVELPWFGFSAFYTGLQLADYVSYLVDFVSNETGGGVRSLELYNAFNLLRSKLRYVQIP